MNSNFFTIKSNYFIWNIIDNKSLQLDLDFFALR